MTRHDVFQTQPAQGIREMWRDITPLGNGLTGVGLYGGCRRDVMTVNRHDLWHDGKDGQIPDLSDRLSKMREWMDAGRYEEASTYLFEGLNEAGYGTWCAKMRTLAQVEWIFDCPDVYRDYCRVIHMDTGEAEIRYRLGTTPYRRRYFVSRRRDLIVTRLETGIPGTVTLTPGFFHGYEGDSENKVRCRDEQTRSLRVQDGCLVYSCQNDDGTYFGLVIRGDADGAAEVRDGKLVLEGYTNATVTIAAFSQESSRAAGERKALQRVLRAGFDYDRLFAEHRRHHRKLYNAADIQLYAGKSFHSNEELLEQARQGSCGLELTEKLWRFARYLFISGSHSKGNPFCLYGLWPGGYDRPWCQNVANENVECIYWHAAVGGLAELVPALIHYYYQKMDTFREAARKLYGCRGIFVSTYSTPSNAVPTPHVPVILHFIGTAGWLSRHFYEYYTVTRDENLLQREILPFMLEAAAFYEDFAVERDGVLTLYPCVSPENTPLNYLNVNRMNLDHPMPVTRDAVIEIAVMKELLRNLIRLAGDHDLPAERVIRWREMLDKTPDYRINEDGAIAEWIDPTMSDNYFHRHLSHVYPLFPGDELEETGRQELVPAFQKAVDLRQLGAMTGWSMAHMASIYARLCQGNRVMDTLSMLCKVCLLPNFFTLHNDYRGMGITAENMGDENFAPVQLDAIEGWANAVQEMLVKVSQNRVVLLPALPVQMEKGSARLHIMGGTVCLRWSRTQWQAELKADRGLSLSLVLPFDAGQEKLTLKAGEKRRFSGEIGAYRGSCGPER